MEKDILRKILNRFQKEIERQNKDKFTKALQDAIIYGNGLIRIDVSELQLEDPKKTDPPKR